MTKWKRIVNERGLRLPGFDHGNAGDDPDQERKDRKIKNFIRAVIERITGFVYDYYREKYGEDPSDRESGEGSLMAQKCVKKFLLGLDEKMIQWIENYTPPKKRRRAVK